MVSAKRRSVRTYLELLGLRTYGNNVKHHEFQYEPVRRLIGSEIHPLFCLLLRNEDISLDQNDPDLFDEELDAVLEHYGPQIWSTDQRNRNHLLEPSMSTAYTSHLEYPRDKHM